MFDNVSLVVTYGFSMAVDTSARFWDTAMSRWELEAIDYEVRVGASSGDIRDVATFTAE